jgi:hypothetical protein
VTGRARTLRAPAVDLRAVSPLATRRDLGSDPDHPARLRLRSRAVNLAGVGGFHDQPRLPARRQRPPPTRSARRAAGPEPADHGLGRSRRELTIKIHLACEGHTPLALVFTASQRGDSPQFVPVLERIRVPPPRARAPSYPPGSGTGPTRPTPRAPTAPTCTAATSPRPSQLSPTRREPDQVRRTRRTPTHISTQSPTATDTPWNAASTCSNTTERSPPATTSSLLRYAAAAEVAAINIGYALVCESVIRL